MTVFISYAHESPEFREKVRGLYIYLRANNVEVIADFDYEIVPPLKGWPAWMQHGIEDADVVIVVCSEKYKARYEKRAPASEGHGVTWEGAILTAGLYDSGMSNDRIYPILPDGMPHSAVPAALQAWDNGHRFPSQQAKILQLIEARSLALNATGVDGMTVAVENPMDSLADEGERVIAQKLAAIVKKYPALFGINGSLSEADRIAVKWVADTSTLKDIEVLVRNQLAIYKNKSTLPIDKLNFELRAVVGHLIGIVWHRMLEKDSPLSKLDKSLVTVPSHQVSDYAELFRDILSALSDARPARN
jgi:hypothetical protein